MSDIYLKLLEHMNRQPFLLPHPPLRAGADSLKELFSEDEADLLTHMTAIPDTPEKITQRAGREERAVSDALERMARRGVVFAAGDDDLRLYGILPFLPGLYEFQFAKSANELAPNAPKLARLFKQYYYEGMGKEAALLYSQSDEGTRKARVIAVERQIPEDSAALPYERAAEIVKSQSTIALINCYCRSSAMVRGEPCKLNGPIDVCLLLGPIAEYAIRYGHGRRISVKEALDALRRSEEAGLIHTASNCKEPMVICNCCSCCCGNIKGLTYFNPPGRVVKSRFEPSVDGENCTGCGECIERCQLHALTLEDYPRLDQGKCIGCGQCAESCPTGAIRLVERGAVPAIPHDSYLDLSMHVARSRGLI